MNRCLCALIAVVLALATGVDLAAAATPTLGVQTSEQTASSSQEAVAASGAAQTNPSNTNVSIRVLSPGNDGSVSQTNSVESSADAQNSNAATQDANQSQAAGGTGACCSSGSTGIQSAQQAASNEQAALALSSATQTGASNTNVPVRVLSPGNDGSVSQSNTVDSDASASNRNTADQGATQTQSGAGGTCACSGSTGIQVADQQAKNEQAAVAASQATQDHPQNTNVSVRVLSPGNGGNVTQSNSVDSSANARNSNHADQSATQSQAAGGSSGGTGIQIAGQEAKNEQAAIGLSAAAQKNASNSNTPIRVLSPGNDGSVSQTNAVSSDASASNRNSTDQDATQTQTAGASRCGCASSLGIQVAGQSAKNHQGALALSAAFQDGASNENKPVRVLSPGNDGSVRQTNSVDSSASASNSNSTDQSATQRLGGGSAKSCGCSGSLGIQALGQESKSSQGALAASFAAQLGGHAPCGCPTAASNVNDPVRVLSPGSGGSIRQSNSVSSDSSGTNTNATHQRATQTQAGASGASLGIQAAGQSARNAQLALAFSEALQRSPSNRSGPVTVLSPGGAGSLSQANAAGSDATGTNRNWSGQSAIQAL